MKPKIAVITPYYKEDAGILQQCHQSVLAQTYPCDHIVVADGHKSDLFEENHHCIHVVLPKSNGDNGNTPRGIGSILANSYGYDAIAYLDADNWFATNHIEKMVEAHRSTGRPVICCKRTFCNLDGNVMPITEPTEDSNLHFDTSCFLIFRPAFSLLNTWFMPKELGPICDRIFFQKVLYERFPITVVNSRTVSFRTQYEYHYQLANMPIPKGAKKSDDLHKSIKYLHMEKNIQKVIDSIGFYPKIIL
jgi:glycosyltransferase involved in cell wall biosynthesis